MHKHTKSTILVLLAIALSFFTQINAETLTTVQNGLYQGQDPWVIYQNGYYYVCQSGPYGPTAIYVSKSKTLADQGERKKVYQSYGNLARIFAPELHYLNGKWYIYACADVDTMSFKHQAVVFEATTADPQGPFNYVGVLFTGQGGVNYMANDFTVFTANSQLYAVWGCLDVSQFPDPYDEGPAIAPMASPTSITADRKFLPLTVGGEGPRVLQNNGKIFVTISADYWTSKAYHLGYYVNSDGNVLNKSSWTFVDDVFNGTTDASGNFTGDIWGGARACFTKSPDGLEDWMFYHSKIWSADGNGWRMANIQRFTWNSDGTPKFGAPIQQNVKQTLPGGDPGLGDVYQAESALIEGGAGTNTNNAGYNGTGFVDKYYSVGANTTFTVTAAAAEDYLVTLRYANGIVVAGEQSGTPTIEPPAPAKLTIYLNGTKIRQTILEKTTDWSHWLLRTEKLKLKAGSNTISYKYDSGDTGYVCLDYIAVRVWPTNGDLTEGGAITAQYSGSPAGEEMDKAFDNTPVTKFFTGYASAWIQFRFAGGVRLAVNKYTLSSANDAPERDPLTWTLKGSNDGSAFTTIDTRSAQDFPNRFQTREFTCTNATTYEYYRLEMTNNSGSALQIGEIQLFASATATPTPTATTPAATATATRTPTATATRTATPTVSGAATPTLAPSATATKTPAPTTTSAAVSYTDNFNDNALSAAWTKFNGTWAETGTILQQGSTAQGDPCKAILSASGKTFGSNQTILAKVYVETWTDGDSARAGVSLFSGTGDGKGYNLLFHNNHSTVQWLDDGTAWGSSYSFTWVNKTWYWFRVKMENGTLSGRIWQDGAAEPTTWPYTWTRSGRTGYPALNGGTSGHGGSCTVFFDDVTVTAP